MTAKATHRKRHADSQNVAHMPERHTLGASMGDSTWDFAPDGQLKLRTVWRSFIGVRVARSMPRPVLSAFQQILERAQPVFDFFLCGPRSSPASRQ